jgi:hypothetical protein
MCQRTGENGTCLLWEDAVVEHQSSQSVRCASENITILPVRGHEGLVRREDDGNVGALAQESPTCRENGKPPFSEKPCPQDSKPQSSELSPSLHRILILKSA